MLGLFPMTLILAAPLTLQTTFLRTYWHGIGHSVVQAPDGGYVIASSGPSCLVKTDAFGDTVWTRATDATGNGIGRSVALTADHGYVVTGSANADVWLLKTDANGNTVWTRTWGGPNYDCGRSVRQTTDGGYIVAGYTRSFGAGNRDAWLIKTDASGDTVWTRTFGGADDDYGWSVAQTADGGYIIAGETWSFGAGDNDAWLIKTDASGDTVWTRTWGDEGYDCGNSVAQTEDGGYVVIGTTESCSTGCLSIWLIKTGPDGDTMWTRTYSCGYESENYGHSVALTADRGYIISGFVSPRDWYEGIWLIKTDAYGDTMWTQVLYDSGGDCAHYEGYSIMQTADSGYVITGHRFVGWVGFFTLLIKTDSDGRVVTAGEPGLNLPVTYKPAGVTTIARAVLYMPEPEMTNAQYPMTLLDIAGRKAMDLRAGPNDVRHLAPGVYFVRPASSIRKVILTR